MNKRINVSEIVLLQTCSACPEQYDVFYGQERIGYLRLRHGEFTVSFKDVGGEVIYVGYPQGDGMFQEKERDIYLERAKRILASKYNYKQRIK